LRQGGTVAAIKRKISDYEAKPKVTRGKNTRVAVPILFPFYFRMYSAAVQDPFALQDGRRILPKNVDANFVA
jgi:hypothetical protein